MNEQTAHAFAQQGPEASARPEWDLFDLLAVLWSQKGVIFLLFIVLSVVFAGLAYTQLKPSYTATSRLLVLLDQENPTPGAAGSGGAFELEQVMQSETEILNSGAVLRLALERQGAGGNATAFRTMAHSFSVERAPNASVLIGRYKSGNPIVAANALNAIVDAYLAYRIEVLVDNGAGGVNERLHAAERASVVAQADLRAFLNDHSLIDFESELTSQIAQVADLRTRLLAAEAARDQARAGAVALSQRLQNIPEQIELYVENNVTGQLLDLRVRRSELISRYQDDAPAVQAIDREIEALQAFIQEGGANGAGQRRLGTNPIYQALDTQRLQLETEGSAQARLAQTLTAQLGAVREDVDRLRGLQPTYEQLRREAQAQSTAAERLSAQYATAEARRSEEPGQADSVRIVERATAPTQAKSMRKLGMMAGVVFAGLIAVFVGFMKGYITLMVKRRRQVMPRPLAPAPYSDQAGVVPMAQTAQAAYAPPASSFMDEPLSPPPAEPVRRTPKTPVRVLARIPKRG